MSAEAWRRTGHMDAAAFCVAGVALSAPLAQFAWQAWHVQYLHRCPRKLGDELVTWTPLLSVWLAWHFQHIRLDLRGRHGTFGTYIDIRGSLATNWSLGRRCFLCGWCGTFFSTPGPIYVAGAAGFSTYIAVRGCLAANWVSWTPLFFGWRAWTFSIAGWICVRGMTLPVHANSCLRFGRQTDLFKVRSMKCVQQSMAELQLID